MKASLLTPNSLNPPAGLSVMMNSKSTQIKETPGRENWILTVNPSSSLEIYSQTGLSKTMSPTLGLKNMPALISITALSWPPP